MALSRAISIIWLDAHIGADGQCNKLKKTFQTELAPAAAVFPVSRNEIDELICCIRQFGAPISFASSVSDALDLIYAHLYDQKRVILITSGTLGEQILPEIQERNYEIYCIYVFCGKIQAHIHWAMSYVQEGYDIQMFDFETDLLIRLSRDLGKKSIEDGKCLLDNDPESALKYFECARALLENAVQRDTPTDVNNHHRPSIEHRLILDGENGLIAQAKRASEHGVQ